MDKVALVTGGSSGIGLATVDVFRNHGWKVRSFSRREGVDVTDASAVSAAVGRIVAEEGRIDALVNNAGMGIFGAAEKTPMEDVRRIMEVNFVSAALLAQTVLPQMRIQGGGRIVNVASLAASFPLPYQSYYTASKAALLAWTRALDGEVSHFGIHAVAVCPGDVRTGFTDARTCADKNVSGCYAAHVSRALGKASKSERGGQSPDVIANCIYSCATAKNPPLVTTPGAGLAWLERVSRILPRSLVSKLIARIYA